MGESYKAFFHKVGGNCEREREQTGPIGPFYVPAGEPIPTSVEHMAYLDTHC